MTFLLPPSANIDYTPEYAEKKTLPARIQDSHIRNSIFQQNVHCALT